ncbi:MAG: L-threonylcarbamoyladenylate synthase [Patescibacteria group bacterium]
MKRLKLTENNINEIAAQASRVLKSGRVVLAPFDTIYGFMADAGNDRAVERIFHLKARLLSKPVGVVFADLVGAERVAHLSPLARDFAAARIPGRYTFIVPLKSAQAVCGLCQQGGTVAFRVPGSELILAIARQSGLILAQTSANKAGLPPAGTLADVRAQFARDEWESIDLIIDGGRIPHPKPSEIFDLTGDRPLKIERS